MYQTHFVTVFMGILSVVQATSLNETNEVKSRILGGKDAIPGEFPFIVLLLCGKFPKMSQCGGSIIHPRWILTAAHCLDSNPCIVLAGRHKITVPEPHQQIRKVERAYPHRRYYRTAAYDIALLKLEKELEMNDKVSSIALPVSRSRPKATERLTLAGWGGISEKEDKTGLEAEILQKIDVFPVNLHSCRKKIKRSGMNYPHIHNLCATGKSVCWGDSGGPMINQDRQLIGVMIQSYPSCSAADYPDIYMRLSAFIGWIKNHVESNNASSYKPYLIHLLIPLQICSLFGILQFNYSL